MKPTSRTLRKTALTTAIVALVTTTTLAVPGGADGSQLTSAPPGTAAGRELPAGPLITLDAINDGGLIAGSNAAGHAAIWLPRTGIAIDLGTLPDSNYSQARAVDDRGRVAGVSNAPAEAAYQAHAFRWTPWSGLTDLGTLGGRWSAASAMNNAGAVVGSSTLSGESASHAFRWTLRDGMTDLGVLPGMTYSFATDIDQRGRVVGYSYGLVPDPAGPKYRTRAFLWTERTGMTDLGALGDGDAEASAINDRGVIAGVATAPDGARHLVRWTLSSGVTDLGTTGVGLFVRGLTDTGVIAGMQVTDAASGTARAFLYTPGVGFQDIGLPVGDLGNSFVNGMNNRTRIIGTVQEGDVGVPYRSYVWQAAG